MNSKFIPLILVLACAAWLTAGIPAKAATNLVVTSPALGQVWAAGSTQTITWNPANPPVNQVGQAAPTVFIDLNLPCPANSSSCQNPAIAPYIIAENAPDTGSYSWSIPNTINLTYQGPVTLTIGLSDSSAEGSSSQFYLVAPNPLLSSLPLIAPNGAEQWAIGSNQTIRWNNASSTAAGVDINLLPITLQCPLGNNSSCDSATSTQYSIASNVPNSGSYFWNIAQNINGQTIQPGNYILSITNPNNGAVIGSSSGVFSLIAAAVTSTSPASSTPPNISGLNPDSGSTGQLINIIGSGFTATGNNIEFGPNTYITGLDSSNGSSVQFNVPTNTQPCPPTNAGACTLGSSALIISGAYGISVSNANGTSNTLPFEVTGTGPTATTTPSVPINPTSPITFPTGDLVIVSGSPTVYLVSGSQFVPFTSAAIFRARGYQWAQVQTIAGSELNTQDISAVPVMAPDGSIVKTADNPTVYLIINGQKSAIPSLSAFNRLGLSFKNLIVLSDTELASYSNAPDQA